MIINLCSWCLVISSVLYRRAIVHDNCIDKDYERRTISNEKNIRKVSTHIKIVSVFFNNFPGVQHTFPISAPIFLCLQWKSFDPALQSIHWQPQWRLHHRLRGSASPVLTATSFVNGKWQFSTSHRIDTPQPITKTFVTGDYVGDPYGCAKLGAYPSTGGFWAYGWNITKIFIYTFFGELAYRSDASTDFHAWWLKRRGLAQGCAFWGNFSHCSPFTGSKPPILGRE